MITILSRKNDKAKLTFKYRPELEPVNRSLPVPTLVQTINGETHSVSDFLSLPSYQTEIFIKVVSWSNGFKHKFWAWSVVAIKSYGTGSAKKRRVRQCTFVHICKVIHVWKKFSRERRPKWRDHHEDFSKHVLNSWWALHHGDIRDHINGFQWKLHISASEQYFDKSRWWSIYFW